METKVNHWQKHFENYDLFLMSHDKYMAMLEFHRQAMKDSRKVLDSGAGTGNLTKILLADGHQVTAVDNNLEALELLEEKCRGQNGLEVVRADLERNLSFQDGVFDGAVLCFVIPYMKNVEKYFQETYRVLKSGGRFSASIPLPIPGFMNGYILPELKKDLEKKKILLKHKKEWQKIVETSQDNEKIIMKNGKSKKEIKELILSSGFQNIEEPAEKPYDEYVYFIKAQKPI